MEILFNDWTISIVQHSQIKQFDDHYHEIRITGDIPAEYSWDLLVHAENYQGEFENIISLSTSEDSLSSTLSANDLAENGWYTVQLRGISTADSSICRHTNLVSFYVDKSLSGDLTWPTLPTEFSQCEARIKSVASHPPIPDENGFWQVWNVDGQAYQSTELPVALQGLQGQPGEKGDKGDAGEKGEKGDKGDTFTYADFTAEQLATLKGDKGDKGDAGATGTQGPTGATGAQGPAGPQGATGATGKSAYASAQDGGYAGTEAQFNADLAAVSSKQSTLTAGDNIDITSDVIKTKVFPCNRNLLDNWLFRTGYTVNQRGVSGTISAVGYFIDRWKLTSGSVTINSDGTLTLNGTMVQRLENAIGQVATATVLTTNGIADVIPVYNDVAKTLTVTANGKTIIAAKLELGSQQTLVHQVNGACVLNELPDYAEQLHRCRRYLYKIPTAQYVGFGVGLAYEDNNRVCSTMFLPVPMVAAPSIVGTVSCFTTGAAGNMFDCNLILQWSTTDYLTLVASKTGAFTAGSCYMLRGVDSNGILLSAEV